MNILEYLIGKRVKVKTDMGVDVELTIAKIEQDSTTRQITPDTKENDWWGESVTTHFYRVKFNTGAEKRYDFLEEINLVEL